MKFNCVLLCLLIYSALLAQENNQKTIYLIPGTGANGELFEKLSIEKYDTVWLEYLMPEQKESFSHYIDRMAAKIDTTQAYSIVGVSLGGMIATELAERLSPEEVIVIAGAKQQSELPSHYHLFRYLPLHRIIGGRAMIWGTQLMQPLFEPMSAADELKFKDMISQKSPFFIKTAVRWMINWKRDSYREDIIHIHGDKDHTLPIKHIKSDDLIKIKDGGHMITYTRAAEISKLLNELL